ncbi:hypothetical protein SLS58_010765 [Diplodia intermedia]|uniref:Kinesin motor domain-containing protein n=1 Tax=Diplodia intermedia TaxID=856260 RepID=A0ABR3T405_9PEZI
MASSNSEVVGTTAASKALAEDTLCCVQWKSEAGHVGCLISTFGATSCRVSCKIGFDSTSQEAVFRISVPVALKASPDNQKTPFFIIIDPQHVSHLHRLALDYSEATQTCVSDLVAHSNLCASSTDVIALQFLLKQPGMVVGPRGTTSIEPRGAGGALKILQCLHALSSATTLTVFLPKSEALVERIGELSTIAPTGVLRSRETSALATLYRGVGGMDVGALLGAFRQPPTYEEVARTTEQPRVRPSTSVSGPALGKRRRTDQEQEEGVLRARAWMERMEQQQSDLGASLSVLRAEMTRMRRGRERARSAAPPEFWSTRPVTRSVSARPEAAALDEVQRYLQQMHAQVEAMEHEMDVRLGAMEQQQQQRVHSEAAAGQASSQPQQQQQCPPAMPLPTSQQTAGVPPPRDLPPRTPNPAPRHQSSSPHAPWSQFSDADRLNALADEEAGAAAPALATIDSDEEAAAAHAQHEAARALSQRRLFADLVAWLRGARSLSASCNNVHAHPDERLRTRLAALGRFAAVGNVTAFDACRAWCSALMFYLHGDDAEEQPQPQPLDPRGLVADLAALLRWADGRRRACDVCEGPVRDDFARLGAAARCAAEAAEGGADGGGVEAAVAAYERQRDVCVARVLTLSGSEGR